MSTSDLIASAMQSAVEEGVFPGAVLLVRIRGLVAYNRAFGYAALIPHKEPASLDTVYDLASLTKPLATATAVLCLVQDGRLSLEDPLHDILEELKDREIGEATVFHLLNHSSGLPAWRPFYERIAEQDRTHPGFLGSQAARQAVLDSIGHESLVFPIGARGLYSDLGFMLLGLLVERLTGRSLVPFCRERVYEPLRADPLCFIETSKDCTVGTCDPPSNFNSVAATEDDPWRGRVLRAEVHDENAYAMGGVAGHAGLFGTASAVLAVSGAWLEGCLGRGNLFSPELVRHFVTRQDRTAGSSWGLGWDTPSPPSSSGTRFSPNSFGHLGYTGTSLWVDPVRELEVILLSNRVHPTRQNIGIQRFRPLIHDLIHEELIAKG